MATGFPVKANYATGDVLTAANMNDLSGTVNYLQYMPPRNPVLNSNFSIWQRGTSGTNNSSSAGAGYNADRWQNYGFGNAITVSRQATGDTTNLPTIQYCARVQRNSGQTGTSDILIMQSIETLNSLAFAGQSVTLSFYARAGANFSAASSALVAQVQTGTGTDQNINSFTGLATPINSSKTLTTTWQRFTATGTIASTATEIGIKFYFTPVGTAGTNDYFEVTGVQLELGSVANTYMPNQPTYQGELAACQRYYERRNYNQVCYPYVGQAYASTSVLIPITYSEKRGTPTLTLSGAWKQLNASGTSQTSTYAFSHQQVTESDLTATTTGMVAGNASLVETPNANTYIEISAEL